MITKRGRMLPAGLWLAVLLLSGCYHARLASVPSGPTDLSGQWVLDATASDDGLRAIQAATPPAPAAPRPGAPGGPGDPYAFGGGPDTTGTQRGGGGGRGGRGGRSQQQSQDSTPSAPVPTDTGPRLRTTDREQFVRTIVLPVEVLRVEQGPGRVLLAQADRRREFEPGMSEPHSVTDRYGSRQVRAGWSGRTFTIASEDHGRVSVEETLTPGAADTLVYEVTLKAWNYRKIHVRTVYRRAGEGGGPPAAADGPTPRSIR